MKIMIDTNVIASILIGDELAEESAKFIESAKRKKHDLLIPPIVLSELYTWVYLDPNPQKRELELMDFLRFSGIRIVLELTKKILLRAGQLHAEYLKLGGKRRRILADFLIGAYAETYSEALVTWNPKDFNLKIPVLTPRELYKKL